jgi:hypothetical protein
MQDDAVISALEQQLACYQRLAKLANVQHEHVRDSRTQDLLLVLKQRQDLLEQIAQFDQAIAPAKADWGRYLAELPAERRGLAESLLAETRRLLEQITAADREDTLVLQQRKLNLGKGINQAAAARKFNQNYAAAAYGTKKTTALDLRR